MSAASWDRIQRLFHDAAALPAAERPAFLAREGGDDRALVETVLGMLEADASGSPLLDAGVAGLAHEALDSSFLAPSLRFGPYRATRLLGEGGMGVVYLALREDLGSVAAVKVLRDAWLSPARRERFASEQRLLAQLNHPSIARLLDADALPDGTPWFAMEYVEGVPLTEFCRARGSSLPERLGFFREVCEAVRHAHRHLVIHRDLKPSNILVAGDGGVKLLDFGISKQLDAIDGSMDATRTGLRLLTPAYAAPEQVRGAQTGMHTDVYALGVILYELLTGRLPFDLSHRTPAEAVSIVAERDPERPSVVAGGAGASRSAWADLDVLCLTAMQKEPARRYGTVDALLGDLDRYLSGRPLDARTDSLAYKAGKFARRHRLPLMAAGAALAAVLGVAAFYTWQLAGARNAAVAEAARTARIQAFMLNLFEGGDPSAGPAEDLRVITLLDRGVQEARTLSRDPAVQAELYATLGGIYDKLGSFERAETLLTTALEQRRTLLGDDHPDVAESLVALGLLRTDQARLEDAERLVRAGLETSRRHHAPGHPRVARATAALGRVLQERGKYDEAILVLEDAVRLHGDGGLDTPEGAETLYELASTYFYAGSYEQSDALNERLLAIYGRMHGESHPDIAGVLVNLGASQHERGRYAAAEAFYRRALAMTEAWHGTDHHQTAATLTMLGRTLVRDDRLDDAVNLLGQALEIRVRVYGPTHPQVASTLNELGTIALQRGRLDAAESFFVRMADIYRAVHGDRHYLLGIARSNLASVYVAREQYARAEAIYREVIERFTATLSADHLNTGIARIKLGRTLVRQARYGEAEEEILAGYDTLARQTSPTVSWLKAAREDLVAVYDALQQPEKAARYRAELATAGAQ